MPFLIANSQTGQVAIVYGDRQVVGLEGDDVDAYKARFGDPVGSDPVNFASFVNKSK